MYSHAVKTRTCGTLPGTVPSGAAGMIAGVESRMVRPLHHGVSIDWMSLDAVKTMLYGTWLGMALPGARGEAWEAPLPPGRGLCPGASTALLCSRAARRAMYGMISGGSV